eukprot:TRINITY_DN34604_c0_g2_i1.p1 TRINITY_DN34604_c0_g2~~TRINITY_DN34604_c0_g2_i1.p1  ORF type:complete len:243 (+),score=23.59 TRINITY_DN34604_c0_g2_i1:51-779(+)
MGKEEPLVSPLEHATPADLPHWFAPKCCTSTDQYSYSLTQNDQKTDFTAIRTAPMGAYWATLVVNVLIGVGYMLWSALFYYRKSKHQIGNIMLGLVLPPVVWGSLIIFLLVVYANTRRCVRLHCTSSGFSWFKKVVLPCVPEKYESNTWLKVGGVSLDEVWHSGGEDSDPYWAWELRAHPAAPAEGTYGGGLVLFETRQADIAATIRDFMQDGSYCPPDKFTIRSNLRPRHRWCWGQLGPRL